MTMTPIEAREAFKSVRLLMHEKAEVTIYLNNYTWAQPEKALMCHYYPFGYNGDSTMAALKIKETNYTLYGDTFEELFEALRTKVLGMSTRHAKHRVDSLASAVILLTAQHGRCTRAMLRQERFSDTELDALGDTACEEANRIGNLAPFKIQPDPVPANGAPVEYEVKDEIKQQEKFDA